MSYYELNVFNGISIEYYSCRNIYIDVSFSVFPNDFPARVAVQVVAVPLVSNCLFFLIFWGIVKVIDLRISNLLTQLCSSCPLCLIVWISLRYHFTAYLSSSQVLYCSFFIYIYISNDLDSVFFFHFITHDVSWWTAMQYYKINEYWPIMSESNF